MSISRRSFILSGAAVVGACSASTVQSGAQIDRNVAESRDLLFSTVPGTRELASRSAGMLIIPEIIEGGFIFSGAYGEGALLVGDAVIDYISMAAAAVGLQIGAQRFSHALFFMTPEALADFRQTDGWELGVDAEVAVIDGGAGFGASTNTVIRPIYQVVYGQRGLIIGASLEGAKYNRLVR
ncbi:twin-arginine translocation pathway signal [Halovulum dunhuangense]|uniref:Twin-arginine translocation pathway signal n=1 Tax=Halovulum dunhuangense TaxID=1505036 RepID=A0A849L3H9_9RHOB|nr:YSC84-related protein [Halovulum dunhuangense]NNU80737.1 twin-arginine translocation pathway signal [Halovulum dunhuangense]